MFERNTNELKAGTLAAPWIADLESLMYLEAGGLMTASEFPDGAASGTLVHLENGEVKKGKGTASQVTGLTRYDFDPKVADVGSSGTMSVVVGGVINADQLPTPADAKSLPATFVTQNSGKTFQ